MGFQTEAEDIKRIISEVNQSTIINIAHLHSIKLKTGKEYEVSGIIYSRHGKHMSGENFYKEIKNQDGLKVAIYHSKAHVRADIK
jgi:hypothetical protein